MSWYKGDGGIPYDIRYSLGRMTNAKWIAKGATNLKVSIDSLDKLNQAFIEFLNRTKLTYTTGYYPRLDPTILAVNNKSALLLWYEYEAFLDVISEGHALIPSNQQFYYDRISQSFEPVFYDTNVHIHGKLSRDNIPTHFRKYSFLGARTLITRFKTISAETLWSELKRKNAKFTLSEIQRSLDNIKSNLALLASQPINNNNQDGEDKSQEFFGNYPENYNKNKKLVYSVNDSTYMACSPVKNNCVRFSLTAKELQKLLAGRLFLNEQYYIYVGHWEGELIEPFSLSKNVRNNKYVIDDNARIFLVGKPKITIDRDKKPVIIISHDIKDSALIDGKGSLDGWSIVYEYVSGMKKYSNDKSFDRMQLSGTTGCLTLKDLAVTDLNIHVAGCELEDAVNFIRVTGAIKSIKVDNALFDGIDADFSNLKINSVNIKTAGNDCVDFSFGIYKIKNVIADSCNDKAISVGENSVFSVGMAKLSNSSIGVAAKDGAVVNIENLKGTNLNQCHVEYNKKPEFGLGTLSISDSNC